MAKKITGAATWVHEVNSAQQHRIVCLRNGIPVASRWYEHHQIAVLGTKRALLSGNEALPSGIFTVTSVPYETL